MSTLSMHGFCKLHFLVFSNLHNETPFASPCVSVIVKFILFNSFFDSRII